MTITFNLLTVANSISQISISNVNVLDLDHIPESALGVAPCLFPSPTNFITNVQFSRVTTGSTEAEMNLIYTLNYTYLHAPVGAGGGLLSVYIGMMTNLAEILTQIFSNSTPSGAIDLLLEDIASVGVISDPAGTNQFHGVQLALQVTEFLQ